ncbi:hypothetical protein D3C75_761610 [compost metagenome]
MAGHTPGAGAGLQRPGDAGRTGRAKLDTERTGLQGEVGRQQGVGARWQSGNTRRHGDLLTDAGRGEAVGAGGRERARIAGHDGIHRVARGTERIAGIGIGQRGAQYVHRTAPPGDECCAGQVAATGHVQQRVRAHVHLVGFQGDAHRADATSGQGIHASAADPPVDAIGGTAIGQRQAGTAGGGDAAGQQFHPSAGSTAHGQTTQLQCSHRRPHRTALLHGSGHQSKRTERRCRDTRCRAVALDAQHRIRVRPVVDGVHGLRRCTRHHPAHGPERRIQARRGQVDRARCQQRTDRRVAGDAGKKTHIAAAVQREMVETGQPGDIAKIDEIAVDRQRMIARSS